jgi:hypothetical protein
MNPRYACFMTKNTMIMLLLSFRARPPKTFSKSKDAKIDL